MAPGTDAAQRFACDAGFTTRYFRVFPALKEVQNQGVSEKPQSLMGDPFTTGPIVRLASCYRTPNQPIK
jgi:hypothetical protein